MSRKEPKRKSKKLAITPAARKAVTGLVVICAGLALLDFVIARKAYSAAEKLPLFYAFYGFIAFLIVVGGGMILRKLVMRPPDYYQKKERGDE